jgi:hypothetical protein
MYAGGKGKLELQPDFQREVVWRRAEQARFIDSLVKRLPIPSMCFSLDAKTQKWKVIDGLQRMTTITQFLGTAEWKVDNVEDIHPLLQGVTNNQLRNGNQEQRGIYDSVEDISVPITVIRCDYENDSHTRYLFTIFNRLNSGGVRLNNQEIRNCIYSGYFNDELKKFDRENKNWSAIKRNIWGSTDRFRSVEVALRALAFTVGRDNYEGNLAGFLNNFMQKASKASGVQTSEVIDLLTRGSEAAAIVLTALGRTKKSLTLVEAVLVGVFSNIDAIDGYADRDQFLSKSGMRLIAEPEFAEGARYALASSQTVKNRLAKAVAVFGRV